MRLTYDLIETITEMFNDSLEYFIISDLEGKRKEEGMYSKYKVTFYTTYDEDDYDDEGNNFSKKCECKELVIAVDSLEDFFKEDIGIKVSL